MIEATKQTKKETISKAAQEEIKKTPKKKPALNIKKTDFFAVIKTGGKQYIVEPGKFYKFEKIEAEIGATIIFDEVYLLVDGENIQIGKPKLAVTVTGKVLEQLKDKKVNVLKYKKRKRIRKTYGHRQPLTKVEIIGIE